MEESTGKEKQAGKRRSLRVGVSVVLIALLSMAMTALYFQLGASTAGTLILHDLLGAGAEPFAWVFAILFACLMTIYQLVSYRRLSLAYLMFGLVPAAALAVYFPFGDIRLAKQRAELNFVGASNHDPDGSALGWTPTPNGGFLPNLMLWRVPDRGLNEIYAVDTFADLMKIVDRPGLRKEVRRFRFSLFELSRYKQEALRETLGQVSDVHWKLKLAYHHSKDDSRFVTLAEKLPDNLHFAALNTDRKNLPPELWAKLLGYSPTLRHLDASDSNLTSHCLRDLKTSTLEVLRIDGCKSVQPEDLVGLIKRQRELKELQLDVQHMSPELVTVVSQYPLERFKLFGNYTQENAEVFELPCRLQCKELVLQGCSRDWDALVDVGQSMVTLYGIHYTKDEFEELLRQLDGPVDFRIGSIIVDLDDLLQILRARELPVFDEAVEYFYLLEQWNQSGSRPNSGLYWTLQRRRFPIRKVAAQLTESDADSLESAQLLAGLVIQKDDFRVTGFGEKSRNPFASRSIHLPCVLGASPEADMW